jgi:hypothetical protein
MAVAVTFTITSSCWMISGSGTLSTRILRVPCQVTARMPTSAGSRPRRPNLRRGAPTS